MCKSVRTKSVQKKKPRQNPPFHTTHQEIEQLISIVKPECKIDASTTEKDIKISLLSGGKQFNITYDTVEFKVLCVKK